MPPSHYPVWVSSSSKYNSGCLPPATPSSTSWTSVISSLYRGTMWNSRPGGLKGGGEGHARCWGAVGGWRRVGRHRRWACIGVWRLGGWSSPFRVGLGARGRRVTGRSASGIRCSSWMGRGSSGLCRWIPMVGRIESLHVQCNLNYSTLYIFFQ